MSTIQVSNLSKIYGRGADKVHALKDVSFNVPEGSIFGFIGPNGAGKSTTISIILQFLHQDTGEVYLFDQPANETNLPILKSKIGFIPDADLPGLPGIKFLKHTGYYYGLQGSKLREKLIEVAELTDTRSFIRRSTKKLSKGQKTKIKIANALIGNPTLIIADEPTTGLDPVARKQFLDLIANLRKENGTSIFFSNHVISEVEKICDEVAIISQGTIVAQGTINSIIHSLPVKNRFTVSVQNISLEELQRLPGVISIEQKSSFEYLIESSDKIGTSPMFLKELINQPVAVESFSRENINLEDVFLSVINNKWGD